MTVVPEDTSAAASPPLDSPVLLILLGASNLARGCDALSRAIRASLHPRPVDVLIASGPGRGYHAAGGLWNAVYPPIQSCALFDAARRKFEQGYRVLALVTDIGNDIMYGVSTHELIESLEKVWARLMDVEAKIYYTTVPGRLEKGINPSLFYILRSVLLPSSRVSYEAARSAIIQINRHLRETVSQKAEWIPDMDPYLGLDEIHYGWLRACGAWNHVARTLLAGLSTQLNRPITQREMFRSYGKDWRKFLATDVTGWKKLPAGYY